MGKGTRNRAARRLSEPSEPHKDHAYREGGLWWRGRATKECRFWGHEVKFARDLQTRVAESHTKRVAANKARKAQNKAGR